MQKHLPGPERAEKILAAAVTFATRKGFHAVTRKSVAREAGVSAGLVSTYFGGMDKLRTEIMRAAVRDEILPIIAAGIMSGHRVAKAAPAPLRQRAANSLAA
jgi:AcrR family transcriptional regulator